MDKATLDKVLDLQRTRQQANDLYGKTLSLELSILDGILETLKAADLTISELKSRFDSKAPF